MPMTSTESLKPVASKSLPLWRAASLRYYQYSFYLKNLFHERIQRVSLNAGFTCPNVDGTAAVGGCVFCDNTSFSPSRRVPRTDITTQLNEGIRRIKLRYKSDRFIAYFQPATNTYAPVEQLRPLFKEALTHPQVVGLAIGTRPDCVADDVLDLLEELAADHFLSVEYGMQTMHNRSLDWMNRAHHHEVTVDAIERSGDRGFEIGVHLILGLPGETNADMLASAREVGRLDVDSVKLHNLYAVKNTPLGEQVARGEVTLMGRDEYVATLVDVLEVLPETIIIERTSGEAPPEYLVGPEWCLNKPAVRTAIDAELQRRDTWQGRLCRSATIEK